LSTLLRNLIVLANYFEKKTFMLKHSSTTQSSSIPSSLCLEEKNPWQMPLVVPNGGLLAFSFTVGCYEKHIKPS
jgi:hypothetical protein